MTTAAERVSGDFGSMLKTAREKRGVSLRHISTVTKISVAALEALERNDISRLPGGIFIRAFVRSYAIEVGLDPDVTIERFIAEFPEAAAPAAGQAAAEQQEEEQQHDSNQRTAATFLRLIAISVPIVAALAYFGTMSRRSDTGSVVPARSETAVSQSPRMPVPGPALETSAEGTAAATVPASSDRVTVAVVATGPCWVSAIVDGERVVSRNVQTGERLSFDVGRSVVLTADDAAALAVTLNGEEARPLGTSGQFVTVRVTPANFKEYLAVP